MSMKDLLSRYKRVDRGGTALAADSGATPAAAAAATATATEEEVQASKKPKLVHNRGGAIPIMIPSADAANSFKILFQCLEGSVTHYYHFFFGAMVPLILHAIEHGYGTGSAPLYRIGTDVGPMKRILCEIPLNVVELRGPNEADNLGGFHDDKSMRIVAKPGETILKACDAYNTEFYADDYVDKLSKSKLRKIVQFFEDTMPVYLRSFPVYDILLIERATDSYYSTACKDRSEIYKSSGSERRSLSNHQLLVSTLSGKHGSRFCNIVLERSSVYYQYHMFRHAKVVIAQHGAALANILFMMKTSTGSKDINGSGTVVEINPPWSRESEHFKNLAHACGVPHASVIQTADHSNVDIDQVIRATDSMLDTYHGGKSD
jgi:hypothetical protein